MNYKILQDILNKIFVLFYKYKLNLQKNRNKKHYQIFKKRTTTCLHKKTVLGFGLYLPKYYIIVRLACIDGTQDREWESHLNIGRKSGIVFSKMSKTAFLCLHGHMLTVSSCLQIDRDWKFKYSGITSAYFSHSLANYLSFARFNYLSTKPTLVAEFGWSCFYNSG
jgi:hypothetical protein